MLPLLIDCQTLQDHLDDPGLVVVDLSSAANHRQRHLPRARHLEIGHLMANRPPVMGLLPEISRLEKVVGGLGIEPESHVVAYDDEANAKACRLLWTLDALGHEGLSLLDGGLQAWMEEGRPLEQGLASPTPTHYTARPDPSRIADKAYILSRLGETDTRILDVRSPAEYEGIDKRSRRGGHIPGAINIEWTNAIDRERGMRLRPAETLRQRLAEADVRPEHEVIVHCHTHQRSAHAYWVLRHLGYERVRGYPGSWSDWGNDPETPIAGER